MTVDAVFVANVTAPQRRRVYVGGNDAHSRKCSSEKKEQQHVYSRTGREITRALVARARERERGERGPHGGGAIEKRVNKHGGGTRKEIAAEHNNTKQHRGKEGLKGGVAAPLP